MQRFKPFAGVAVLALALAGCGQADRDAADAQLTALADRAAIEEMLTDYYNHFGGGVQDKIAEYYAEDGEMILGTRSFKGIDAIKGMYASVPADAPQRQSFALNILIGNMAVKVDGDTATARLVYTETIVEKEGDAPHILVQGREFDWLEKQADGGWLIKKRQIMGPNEKPEGWVD